MFPSLTSLNLDQNNITEVRDTNGSPEESDSESVESSCIDPLSLSLSLSGVWWTS